MYYPHRDYRNAKRILKVLASRKCLKTHEIAESMGSRRWEYPQNRTIQILERLKELGYCQEYRCLIGSKHKCGSKRFMVERKRLESELKFVQENKKKGYGLTCKDGCILGRLLHGMFCYGCYESVEPNNDEEYKIEKVGTVSRSKLNSKVKLLYDVRYWFLTSNGELAALVLLKDEIHDFIANHKHNKVLHLVDLLLSSYKKEYVSMLINNLASEKNSPNLIPIAEKWYNAMVNRIKDWDIDKDRCPLLAKYRDDLNNSDPRKIIMPSRRYR